MSDNNVVFIPRGYSKTKVAVRVASEVHVRTLVEEYEKLLNKEQNPEMIVIDSLSSLSKELSEMNCEVIDYKTHKVPFWANDWRRKC